MKELSKETNILIVGLGLMGGSYAMALKRQGYKVKAITRTQSSIDYAIQNGLIDGGTTEPDERLISEADIVIFALYPKIFLEWIEKYQHYLKSGAMLTDVTGVKGSVAYAVQAVLREDVEFVSAHPMTGREVYGVQNSTDSAFGESNYIVTPTEKNTAEGIALCKRLGEVLGFGNIVELTPQQHDERIAFVSQLTHCIAITLMTCNEIEGLENFTGNSFRDLTRIAHINENMWTELFMLNRAALLNEMDLFEKQFMILRGALANGDEDAIKDIMRKSTERRDRFDGK